MVLVYNGVFEVQLVEAVTKIPFTEHTKNGKTYIEVEPDANYWISVRKVAVCPTAMALAFKVDGKRLGLKYTYSGGDRGAPATYRGIADIRGDGTVLQHSLKFVKPSKSNHVGGNFETTEESMGTSTGTVEIEIFAGNLKDQDGRSKTQRIERNLSSEFGVAAVARGPTAGPSKKKCLRSSVGQACATSKLSSRRLHDRLCVHRLTLSYCATPGLILAGILPRYESDKEVESTQQSLVKEETPTPVRSTSTSGNPAPASISTPVLADEVVLMDVRQECAVAQEVIDLCLDD